MTDQERLASLTMASQLGHDLMRFELRYREEKIARIILDASVGRGLREITIPRLDDIGGQVGITKGNVDAALEQLHSMRIIRVAKTGKTITYEFNTIPEQWRCRAMVTPEESQRCRNVIDAFNQVAVDEVEKSNRFSGVTSVTPNVPAGTVPGKLDIQWNEFPKLD